MCHQFLGFLFAYRAISVATADSSCGFFCYVSLSKVPGAVHALPRNFPVWTHNPSQRGIICSEIKILINIFESIMKIYSKLHTISLVTKAKASTATDLDLQFVLVVGVRVCEVSELLGLVEAPLQVLGRDKVLRHFDAVVDVSHLNIFQ